MPLYCLHPKQTAQVSASFLMTGRGKGEGERGDEERVFFGGEGVK